MKYETLKLRNQLCHPLYSAANALIRIYDPYLKEIDLTYPQYLVMMALWEEDKVTMGQLSDATLFDSGSLTPLVKRLAEKNLIQVTPSKEDLRQKIVTLTKKGEKLKSDAVKIPELMLCHLSLSSNEMGTLKKLLEKLRLNLRNSAEASARSSE